MQNFHDLLEWKCELVLMITERACSIQLKQKTTKDDQNRKIKLKERRVLINLRKRKVDSC